MSRNQRYSRERVRELERNAADLASHAIGYEFNDNGSNTYFCHFCLTNAFPVEDDTIWGAAPDPFPHDLDCPALATKDLLTGIMEGQHEVR